MESLLERIRPYRARHMPLELLGVFHSTVNESITLNTSCSATSRSSTTLLAMQFLNIRTRWVLEYHQVKGTGRSHDMIE